MTAGRRMTVLLVILGAVAAIITACGDDSDAEGPGDAGHQHPTGQGPVPGALPDDSVQEALSRIYSWEPSTEANSGVAMARAIPWLAGEMLAAAQRPGDDAMRPMRQWAKWRQDKAIVTATVKVIPVEDPPGATTATRTATVLQLVQRVDGSSDPFTLMTYSVDLTRDADQRWKLWRINITDSRPLPDGVIQ